MHTILFIAGFVIALNTSQPEYVKRIQQPRACDTHTSDGKCVRFGNSTDYSYMIPCCSKSIYIPGLIK
ncbi:hypothetical protein [Sulfuricurvum sp.]|uniref:hypothetical protein n=1 Tax=Sulfuricurvum sp. TaxID=2025608 RepID=UPI003562BB13